MLSNAKLKTVICTTRIADAEVFYRDLLGLSLTDDKDGTLIFDVSGSELRVSPVPELEPSEHTLLGFEVPNIKEVVLGLIEKGIDFERFDHFPHDKYGILNAPGGTRVAWLRDPDRNLISVFEEPKEEMGLE